MKHAQIVDGVVHVIHKQPRDGLVEVPSYVFPGYTQNPDGTFTAPEPSAPTPADVDRARDAYLAEGVMVHLENHPNPIHVRMGPEDYATFNALSTGEGWRGPGDFGPSHYTCANNHTHELSSMDVPQFLWAVVAHKRAVDAAAAQLKAMNPIPADYATNPAYWPPNGL